MQRSTGKRATKAAAKDNASSNKRARASADVGASGSRPVAPAWTEGASNAPAETAPISKGELLRAEEDEFSSGESEDDDEDDEDDEDDS